MTWKYGAWGNYLPLKGRVFIALLFIVSGILKMMGFAGFAGMLASIGFPAATVVAGIVVAIEILGGLALALGFHARIAAWILALFVLATILVAHRDLGDPMQMSAALKNLAIIGGLIYVIKFGSGRWSLSRGSDCGCCDDGTCVCDRGGSERAMQ